MPIKTKKKYKAIFLDVDGTLVCNKYDGKISSKVKKTILESSNDTIVGIVSGRPLERVTFVFDDLQLTKPCAVSGGAQIVDPISRKILWEQAISPEDVGLLRVVFESKPYKIWVVDDGSEKIYQPGMPLKKPFSFFMSKILDQQAEELMKELNEIPTLALTKVVAYTEGYTSMHITHANATKKHAVMKVAELLSLNYEDIIGVGDGYNDYPLFKACGLKVAVGNAVLGLKERADYIAPSVENDGVADVFEQFLKIN